MWQTIRMSPKMRPDLLSSVMELLRSTSRNLILAIGVIYLAWQFVVTTAWTEHVSLDIWVVSTIVALASVLAWQGLGKRYLISHLIWQGGLAAAITLAVYLFQMSEIALGLMLLPLISVITIGWPAGLLAEGVVIALVWWLSCGLVALPPSTPYSLGIILGGLVAGVSGWAVTSSLLTATQWYFSSFDLARRRAEKALQQRVEFKQIQEDLITANRELARLSDRLKAMQQIAEEARRAKEQFVANVSHELRTPLNLIIGFSEMITQSPHIYGATLPPKLLADIKAIQRNSQHLSRLVNDVLDLGQVDAGRMTLSKEWTSIQDTIGSAVAVVQMLYQSKGLYLITDIASDLPNVLIDDTRVRQIVINLLSNAGRFTEAGGVRIQARRDKEGVVVTVADTGPGISLGDQQKLFEPFVQLDASIRRRHGGSGLGLSISKRLVEMHGGRIWVESPSTCAGSDQGGPGTAIHFSLPVEVVPGAGLDADDARRWFSPYADYEYRTRTRRSSAPVPVPGPRYVVLEEGTALRQSLERYVANPDIVSVRNAQEAVEALSHSPAQALIANAPMSSALQAAVDGLSDLPYQTPLISCWVPGKGEAAKTLGVVEYLVKPISAEDLVAALDRLGDRTQRVLLVDDQPEIQQLFSRMLSFAQRRYQVIRAMDGQRALELLRERQPDVMLLDLVMPRGDGFQVLRKKSQDPTIRDIPVIVISARDPARGPVVSDALTVTRGGGLAVSDLVACIQAVSDVLAPSAPRGRSEQQLASLG